MPPENIADLVAQQVTPIYESYQAFAYRGGAVYHGRVAASEVPNLPDVRRALRHLHLPHGVEKMDDHTRLTLTIPSQGVDRRKTVHVLLIVATILTTLAAGTMQPDAILLLVGGLQALILMGLQFLGGAVLLLVGTVWPWLAEIGRAWTNGALTFGGEAAEIVGGIVSRGAIFSVAIMTILGIHELSHYLVARRHGVHASLPYFIPMPLPPIGTMGALIKMRSPITHRRALFDIGVSGPIAGFIAATVACTIGIYYSRFGSPTTGGFSLGESLLFKGLIWLIHGPVPAKMDLMLHPLAFAGWLGLFVTAMNLIPYGQLDGGHVSYALQPRRHEDVGRAAYLGIALLGICGALFMLAHQRIPNFPRLPAFWPWLAWAVVIRFILKPHHPPLLVNDVVLDTRRKMLGVVVAVIFILSFVPDPFKIMG